MANVKSDCAHRQCRLSGIFDYVHDQGFEKKIDGEKGRFNGMSKSLRPLILWGTIMLIAAAIVIAVVFMWMKMGAGPSVTLVKDESASIIYVDKDGADYDGLSLIAEALANDIELVTGVKPAITSDADELSGTPVPIIAGSIGNNELIDRLIEQGKLDVSSIRDKWETYKIQVVSKPLPDVEEAVIIVGSDKRGTIYGMFRISELIGVSPWVYWADVLPETKEELTLPVSTLNYESKEPSVKYRGIFLNDEWPSLGSWTLNRFGGFNEYFYDKVYELILRLKGNYLWPAMWSASFSEDGSQHRQANAELADKYGIVMGTSHHEPMYRQGVEWQQIYNQYGNSNLWDFRKNGEAITKFWEDGVLRNKDYDNIVTIGMRGEADSALGGGVAENIELLKDIVMVQKELLKKHGIEDKPKVLTIYKEVEKFWHGTDTTPGLKHWDQLDDVIIMLTEDNFGNLRTLPTDEERDREAGWGMYYHFDYHGAPTSYEWINTIQLEKVWEQMSMAYDYGVRDIWIVNVGDLKPMELPISYFLDLAYDFETWGTEGINKTKDYLIQWTKQQFGHVADEETIQGMAEVLADYTKLNGSRKPEVTRTDTYSITNFQEADRVLAQMLQLEERASLYYERIPDSHKDAYFQLVYYPAVASANVKKMHIYAAYNERYFGFYHQSVLANWYARLTEETIKTDEKLQYQYNYTIADSKWRGMMSSPHIGYVTWNSDGWQYPQVHYMTPRDDALMIVDTDSANHATISGTLELPAFTSVGKEQYKITISNGGTEHFDYTIETDEDWILLSQNQGTVRVGQSILVSIDWDRLKESKTGRLKIEGAGQVVHVEVKAEVIDTKNLPQMTFVETHGIVSIEAEHTSGRKAASGVEWKVIENYGRTLSSMKMFPTTVSFDEPEEAPYLEYSVYVSRDGNYTLTAYFAPTNNLHWDSRLRFALGIDDEKPRIIDVLPWDFVAGESGAWSQAVTNNVHTTTSTHYLKAGTHTIRIYGLDAGLVLQKLVLSRDGLPTSYLGPVESYYVGSGDRPSVKLATLEADERFAEFDLFPVGQMKPRMPDWGEGTFVEQEGEVWIEAELALEQSGDAHATELGQHAWRLIEGASHFALHLLPDAGSNWTNVSGLDGTPPSLTYRVQFESSGEYHVWLLARTPDPDSDSIHVGLDGSQQFTQLVFNLSNQFEWHRAGTLNVPDAGMHELNLWGREDGFAVDKIYITKHNHEPAGTGGEVKRNGK